MSYYSEWQSGIRNRNYFILQELLRRPEVNRVIIVDYLPMSLKQVVKELVSSKFKVQSSKLQFKVQSRDMTSTLFQISDKLLVYSTVDPLFSKKIFLKKLKELYWSFGLDNWSFILWSYFPLYIDYYDQIPADIKIFDAVDDWSEHPSYKKYRGLLKQNYQKIAKKADVIFTVSDNLRRDLFQGQRNVFWIPNGVDFDNLKTQNSKLKTTTKNLNLNSKLTIGYVGTIQSRLDFKLIKYAAEHHPDKEFVFVGPVWKDAKVSEVKNCRNVKFIGRIPYDKIADYLAGFDIGIIPHKVDEFTRSMDPMKFYEYLAAGLPVISTQQLVTDYALLYYAPSDEEFSQAIDKALIENNEEKIALRQQYAKENSWEKRVGKMVEVIGNF